MTDIYREALNLTESSDVRKAVVGMPKNLRLEIINEASRRVGFKPSVAESAYIIANNLHVLPTKICPVCNTTYFGKFYSVREGYRFHDRCSRSCRSKDPAFKKKLELTNLEKYGHRNNMWGNGIREETKSRWLEKWGVDNPLKVDEVKSKVVNTNKINLGVSWPASAVSVRNKYKLTMLERYGVDNSLKTGNSQKTCLDRYGVSNPMQNPKIFQKSQRFKRKTGTLPSGKTFEYQGYENVAVEKLISDKIDESEIIISEPSRIPVIEYHNPIKGKMCHYFPDIYIPSENLLIEVKSTWTMKNQLQENIAKHRAAKAAGYRHEIWVCTASKLLEIVF